MPKNHRMHLSFIQETGGESDGDVLLNEYTDDDVAHVVKCAVFGKHLLPAIAAAQAELAGMAIAELTGGTPARDPDREPAPDRDRKPPPSR